jgi:hypothetical protein
VDSEQKITLRSAQKKKIFWAISNICVVTDKEIPGQNPYIAVKETPGKRLTSPI